MTAKHGSTKAVPGSFMYGTQARTCTTSPTAGKAGLLVAVRSLVLRFHWLANMTSLLSTKGHQHEIRRCHPAFWWRTFWPDFCRAGVGDAVSEDNLELRPYVSGADVMATWHRCTGWIPPSKDPRYIKKWMDFQLEMLDSRRRAIELQFAMNFMKEPDEANHRAQDGEGLATYVDACRDPVSPALLEAPPMARPRRRREKHSGADGAASQDYDSGPLATPLD